jgi:polysaccharide export outer membrane protein
MLKTLTFSIALLCLIFLKPEAYRVFAEQPPPSYQIGAGDLLSIHVWKEADLTKEVTVLSDGKFSFPLIGEVVAQGQTVTSLRDVIAERLKKYVTAPEVTVMVKEAGSRKIYTIGKVNKPGVYPLEAHMTVIQALSAAGGFEEWADTKGIVIIRKEAGKEIQIPFNYNDLVGGKNPQQNIPLKPGDTIVVP